MGCRLWGRTEWDTTEATQQQQQQCQGPLITKQPGEAERGPHESNLSLICLRDIRRVKLDKGLSISSIEKPLGGGITTPSLNTRSWPQGGCICAQELGQSQFIPRESGPMKPQIPHFLPEPASLPVLGLAGPAGRLASTHGQPLAEAESSPRGRGNRRGDGAWTRVCGPGRVALMLGPLPPGSPTLLALASASGPWMQTLASGPCCALHQECRPCVFICHLPLPGPSYFW